MLTEKNEIFFTEITFFNLLKYKNKNFDKFYTVRFINIHTLSLSCSGLPVFNKK